MQAKIEWYKELLELDPSSKVFFHLSRLLADEERLEEAVEFLEQGVVRHPEHLESRFLLLDLLTRLADEAGAARQAEVIGEVLERYPIFWKAYARLLSGAPDRRDAALALDFVAVHFQGAPVTWGEIIQRGLEGMFQADLGALPAALETPRLTPLAPEQPSAMAIGLAPVEAAAPSAATGLDALAEPARASEPAQAVEPVSPAPPAAAPAHEEVYSIRTRTMARLLAEQGDYAGALDIYRELLLKARDDAEREELDAIIERQQILLREAPRSPRDATPPLRTRLEVQAEPELDAEEDESLLDAILDEETPRLDLPGAAQLCAVPEASALAAASPASPIPAPGSSPVSQPAAQPVAQPAAQVEAVASPPADAPAPRKRPVSVMERLAQRLERRAAG